MRINSEAAAGKMKHNAKQSGSPQYSCEYGDFSRQPFNEETYKDKKNEDIDDNVIPSSTTSCLGVRRDAKKHGKREGTLKLKEKDNIGLGEEGKLLNDENVSKQMDDHLAYEYHDLIIEVFRQVWSDMRQGALETQLMVGLGKEFNGGVGMLCAHSWNE
ncbi:hypothetical protein JHK87_024939 [Glycine soja]|nr:hypothetical protein JHK87_024939 [Glycine soja]